MTEYGPTPPAMGDLAAATAATQAAISDPHASLTDVMHAAETEQAAFRASGLREPEYETEAEAG